METMDIPKKKLLQLAAIVFPVAIGILILFIVLTGNEKPVSEAPWPTIAPRPETFTFFDLNVNSRYSKELREKLSERLNGDAYASRTPIDLELHGKGFLENHFPVLDQLNRQLNYLPRERVEHNTIQLTYRYARKKDTPFDYIRLVFSGYTLTPLMFHITAGAEGADVLDTIVKKYGQPKTIPWRDGKGQSFRWEKDGDIMVISETTSRIGSPEYHFGIYFIDTIKHLLKREEQERLKRKETLEKKGQTAF